MTYPPGISSITDRLLFWRELPGVPVLRYGDVSDLPTWRSEDTIAPAEFERQIAWLSGKGYTAYTIDDLRKRKMVKRAVVITFDGGTRDTYRTALPMLDRYHFQASVFVATGVIGDLWCGGRGDARQCVSMMDEWELRDLAERGWSIANYFTDGKPFRHVDRFAIERAFEEGKNRLRNIRNLEAAEQVVAYPGGVVTAEVLAAMHAKRVRLGFALGDRLYRLTDPKFLIPRFRITRDMPFSQFTRIFSPTYQRWQTRRRGASPLEELARDLVLEEQQQQRDDHAA